MTRGHRAVVPALVLLACAARPVQAQTPAAVSADAERRIEAGLRQVVTWRRDFHQHPELGMQETRTAKVIADHLRSLGLEVQTGVPGAPAAVVGILMGAATALAGMREQLPGTVKFLFQPAEEGPGGADPMVKAGVLKNPDVHAVFGLHVCPFPAGQIVYRSGPLMASADEFTIVITGKQTHGAVPWGGVDPIVIGAQIVTAFQSIVSRQVNISEAPAVVTVGKFAGGNRANIIPDTVELVGTVRAFDEGERAKIQQRIRAIATNYAEASGATATITFGLGYPVTCNDPALTEQMVPTLKRVAGEKQVVVGPLTGTAEDFSYFQQAVPGLYFFLGVTPSTKDPKTVASNHSPLFFADESALPVGVRAMTHLTLDYLFSGSPR